ncbi:hypothetical protein BBJ28_00014236 [Nothophytophthora sp. Chile5]|nr:hypothetical protein BBJ28_00014236 [Nothophytophthora sp. Chile5]
MSKAPKAKKATLHYQPYQSVSPADSVVPCADVASGLSSNLSRNLWDDWNENDANFGMKFDMFTDEASTASTASTTASPNPAQSNLSLNSEASALTSANSYNRLGPMGYEQQHSGLAQSPLGGRGATPTSEDPQKPRANFQRSLSEDIVSMLDEGDMSFGKQLDADQRRDLAMQNMMFNPAAGHNAMAFQQQQQQMQMHQNHLQQFQQHQMQMQLQQQLQQQQQQFQQQQMGSAGLNWTNGFNGGMQPSANASPSGSANEASVSRRKPLGPNPTALDIAAAEAGASLTGMPSPCPDAQAAHAAATATTSSLSASSTSAATQHPGGSGSFGFQASRAEEKPEAAGEEANAPPSSEAAAGANASSGSSSEASASTGQPQPQMNGFNSQGMMMPGFMMYPMPMMGNYPQGSMGMNMMPMGMPMGSMQMPMGMNMNGMQMPMQMQLQLQLQMAQMASMNGMNGMNGMQMGLGGMPMNGMGMNTMQMPMNVNMQQQPVNPQSGMAGDVEMTTPAPSVPASPAVTAAGVAVAKPPRSLQPKDVVRGGPGFVTIARKPEEPEMSSILKSLMDEEAKKKEKKLERNRDSARESRKKQQTYVETLENGIKRLQINRDLVRSYRWGLTGPGFGPLPCPNSPQMFDWKNRVEVVTGRSEAFSNLQNPAGFQSLMRLNRQRRTLTMQRDERERAVWKCFVVVGRQLAAMRTRVLQVQVLRTFSENPLAMELDAELQLSADQKLQLQCHAQQMFNEEVVQLTTLFKIFFALRNEALRLNLLSPSLELFFRETCSFDQLQRLLQWTETQRSVIETGLPLDDV